MLPPEGASLLDVDTVEAGYGRVQVLWGASLDAH